MSDQTKPVFCGDHGERYATFVCQHLPTGSGLGFIQSFDPEGTDDPWPDAWCGECEKVLLEEGEWNDRSEAFAKVKLLCSVCYELAKERNTIET